jgi:RNA polymerase sigma factor (sigma-70 family)
LLGNSIFISQIHKFQGLNEIEIIRGCQKKDAGAQHRLFEKYAGTLMTICRRYACDQPEAEDMLQDAFINVFSHINQFKSIGSFEGWLRKVTVNAAIRVLQKRKIRFTEIKNDLFELASPDATILSDLGAEDLLKIIHQLPDGYRTVFNLYVLEGYSHEEIGQLLKIQTATSRSQLSKARAILKDQIISLQKIQANEAR